MSKSSNISRYLINFISIQFDMNEKVYEFWNSCLNINSILLLINKTKAININEKAKSK